MPKDWDEIVEEATRLLDIQLEQLQARLALWDQIEALPCCTVEIEGHMLPARDTKQRIEYEGKSYGTFYVAWRDMPLELIQGSPIEETKWVCCYAPLDAISH